MTTGSVLPTNATPAPNRQTFNGFSLQPTHLLLEWEQGRELVLYSPEDDFPTRIPSNPLEPPQKPLHGSSKLHVVIFRPKFRFQSFHGFQGADGCRLSGRFHAGLSDE